MFGNQLVAEGGEEALAAGGEEPKEGVEILLKEERTLLKKERSPAKVKIVPTKVERMPPVTNLPPQHMSGRQRQQQQEQGVTEAGDSPHPSIGNDDEKIDTHDRETDGGEEECLRTKYTVNCEGERTLAPARNAAAVSPRKAGARRRPNQLPRHDM
jgi:hypothetical protein